MTSRLLLQSTEVLVSICLIAGGLFLGQAGLLLIDEGSPWAVWGVLMLVAAGLAAVTAVLPWLWPGLSLDWRRAGGWSAWLIGTVAGVVAMLPLEYEAFGGAQLILLGLVLSEMNGRPSTLRWFFFTGALIVATLIAYYALVDLRPVAD